MRKFENSDTSLTFANRKFEDFYMNTTVRLLPLEESEREQFIIENQRAFNYGAMEEFGLRNNHFEEEEQIIARETIEQSIDSGEAYHIVADNKKVGGVVVKVDGDKGELELLFVSPEVHSKGIGYAALCEIEKIIQKYGSGKP